MPKRQKSVSISEEYYLILEDMFNTHKEELTMLDINSIAQLLRALAKFGTEAFLSILGEVHKSRSQTKGNLPARGPRSS